MRSLTVLIITLFTGTVYAHSGGVDSNGGHFNRKSGEYHCHRPGCVVEGQKVAKPGAVGEKYNRKSWPHWIDADRDCQNTRAEILIRDSLEKVQFKRSKGCLVTYGRWEGPYTGQIFTKASDLDIDHLVPLYHAHKTGGGSWSREMKKKFANDPDNLLAVDDATNQAKGAKSPVRRKPPLKSYWCEYAERWNAVKARYGLIISNAEEQSLAAMMERCG